MADEFSMIQFLLFLLALIMAFAVAFAAGSNDEMMAPGVAARVFSLRTAIILGAVFSIIGAVSLGKEVAKTIGEDLISGSESGLTDSMIIAVLIAMILILVSTSIMEGLPISTTQAVVGAVVGVAVVAGLKDPGWGIYAVNYIKLIEIFVGWIISPILGFVAAATTHFWLLRIEETILNRWKELRKTQALIKDVEALPTGSGRLDRQRLDRWYSYTLGFFLIAATASRAGNDVANSIAPVIGLKSLEAQNTSHLMLIGGVGMALGIILVGHKVIKVVAREIVSMNAASALSAMISVTIIMTFGTLAGFPLSGTHVLVFAMIAVGWAEHSQIKKRMVNMIIISWIITVPIAAVLGAIIWFGVDWVFVLVGII